MFEEIKASFDYEPQKAAKNSFKLNHAKKLSISQIFIVYEK